jgi:hypothetical protein
MDEEGNLGCGDVSVEHVPPYSGLESKLCKKKQEAGGRLMPSYRCDNFECVGVLSGRPLGWGINGPDSKQLN